MVAIPIEAPTSIFLRMSVLLPQRYSCLHCRNISICRDTLHFIVFYYRLKCIIILLWHCRNWHILYTTQRSNPKIFLKGVILIFCWCSCCHICNTNSRSRDNLIFINFYLWLGLTIILFCDAEAVMDNITIGANPPYFSEWVFCFFSSTAYSIAEIYPAGGKLSLLLVFII